MALNPSIILAGQPVDVVGSMAAGNQLAAQTNQLRDQNALRQVYQTQGAGILSGDQNALNALAAIDPAQALNMQGGVIQNRTATRQLEILNAQEKRQLEAAAAQMSEAQRAEAAAAAKQEVLKFISAPTPEIFDQMVTQAGKPELRGMWENRQVLGAEFVSSVEEALKLSQGPAKADPIKGAPSGYKWVDPNNPAAGVAPLPGYERSSGVTINTGDSGAQMGTIPQGYAVVPAPDTPAGYRMVPIPGGPEDTASADAASAESSTRTADVVLEDIGRLKNLVSNAPFYSPAAGFGAERLAQFGGTNAADAAALAETIGANIGFDRLQAMREASPTGGALGNVTERELQALRSVLGSIELSQSPEQLLQNLNRLEEIYQGIMAKAAAYPNAAQFGFQPATPETPAAPADPAQLSDDDLLRMYGG